jgi:hypothetical protein
MAAKFLNETLTGASGPSGSATDIEWTGGPGTFITHGTYGGATFQLQFSLDAGSTWSSVPGAEMTHTTNSVGSFQLCPCLLRISWSGGSLSTSVKARVAPSWQGWWNDPTTIPTT